MDFTAYSRNAAVKAVREGTYTDELKTQVAEAWEAQQSVGEGNGLQATFADEAAAKEWLRKAQAYGKTQDLFVSKDRTVAVPDNVLAFTVQIQSVRQAKIAERKAKAEDLVARKAAGEVITRGRRKAE
jgi:hypothetical protein